MLTVQALDQLFRRHFPEWIQEYEREHDRAAEFQAECVLRGFDRAPDYDPTYARHVTTLREVVGWEIVPSLLRSSDQIALRNLVEFIEHIAADGEAEINHLLEDHILASLLYPPKLALDFGPATRRLI